jgi:hypothetical protein
MKQPEISSGEYNMKHPNTEKQQVVKRRITGEHQNTMIGVL